MGEGVFDPKSSNVVLFSSFFTLARFAGDGRVREHMKDTKFGK
jgi:hypothetical protein